MELKIYTPEEQIQEIKWNNEEIKKEVADKVEIYKNLVYSDDQIKDAKADRALLNKFRTALEDKRKEIKKQCLKPYEDFEAQVKEIVAIVDEPILMIDTQVKDYEDEQKEQKRAKIAGILSQELERVDEDIEMNQLWDERWLNNSFSLKKVQESIRESVEKINADLNTIAALPEYSFESKEAYLRTLDLNFAIAEGQRLADIQKRKEEAEAEAARQKLEADIARRKAEDEKQEETVKTNISDQEDIENMAGYTEPKQWIQFQAYMTVSQARELKAFFENRSIEFKAV